MVGGGTTLARVAMLDETKEPSVPRLVPNHGNPVLHFLDVGRYAGVLLRFRRHRPPFRFKWALWDSNPGPTDYESAALTV